MSNTTTPETNLFDPNIVVDPWETYKHLRDNSPVYFDPVIDMHVITRYDYASEALKNTHIYSSRFDKFIKQTQTQGLRALPGDVQSKCMSVYDSMIPVPPTMLTLDPPDHTKFRTFVDRLFTARNLKETEPFVVETVENVIDQFPEEGGVEFMSAFASRVPFEIVAKLLGVPDDQREFFFRAGRDVAASFEMASPPADEAIERAERANQLQQLFVQLIEERRKNNKDDLIGIMASGRLEGEDRLLTHGECISILNQFLAAGMETTASTFGHGVLILCKIPELQDQIRGNKVLIKKFIEETLRLESPSQGIPRIVTEDTTLGGYALKAGEKVMVRFGAANRDERKFTNPDALDLERKQAGAHLAFGSGVHHCVGAPLARQELFVGFDRLLNRFKDIRLRSGFDGPQIAPSVILRAFPTLEIDYRKT